MALTEKDEAIIEACRDTDEPIFVLRGKDILSASIIAQYREQFRKHGPENQQFLDQVTVRLNDFQEWQNHNIGKVRYPD